ncbi:hypothetical protein [Qipengyuania sediminis]|uniref:hypothetical protein n=1 Tax=Qipengyuania sediminis TaxID=1532023 RepID=UPI00105A1958|nr:hypothetical protein [Qipengyuania sediminis]
MEFVETNWLLILLGALAVIAVAWYIFHATRRTTIAGERRDVLDEGAAPAPRNQALIDTPPPGPAPGPSVTPATTAPEGSDLTRIKGVGPKLVAELAALGVTRVEQVASWTKADEERIDAQLGRFQGRVARDEWVAQAKLLSTGDAAGYAQRFGNTS